MASFVLFWIDKTADEFFIFSQSWLAQSIGF